MKPEPIFVFGSNTAGRHGAGAALFARQHHGAVYGQAEGLQGSSYAIPTRDGSTKKITRSLPLSEIEWHVIRFVQFAADHPELNFTVTRIGCGLGGYRDDQIAPFFFGAPVNCALPPGWRQLAEVEPRLE